MLWLGVGVLWIGGLVGFVLWAYSGDEEYAFDNGLDLPANVSGQWDWSTRDVACGDSAHVIAFSDDAKLMTITHRSPTVDSTGRDLSISTYDVLSVSPSRIRGAIRGETRLTEEGIPVVWDLIMFGPDEYRWQRTDWPAYGYTPAVQRCPSAPSR